jgi:factor associated with neutral sphingomyelinase activation
MPPPGKLDVSGGAGLRGRLRLCSLSLMFDPDEHRLPILKFPLSKVEQLERDDAIDGAMSVKATQWLRMKAGGVDAPYVTDKSGPAVWRFSLAFAKLSALLVRAQPKL